jgi:hypothetical protein
MEPETFSETNLLSASVCPGHASDELANEGGHAHRGSVGGESRILVGRVGKRQRRYVGRGTVLRATRLSATNSFRTQHAQYGRRAGDGWSGRQVGTEGLAGRTKALAGITFDTFLRRMLCTPTCDDPLSDEKYANCPAGRTHQVSPAALPLLKPRHVTKRSRVPAGTVAHHKSTAGRHMLVFRQSQ